MGGRLIRGVLVVFLLSGVAVAGGLTAYASAPTKKVTPTCKAGEKSTKAKPCALPVCKKGQTSTKAKPCAKAASVSLTITLPNTVPPRASSPTGTGTATTTTTRTSGNVPALPVDKCPPGTTTPLNEDGGPQDDYGDGDDDNQSGFMSDGDGCY